MAIAPDRLNGFIRQCIADDKAKIASGLYPPTGLPPSQIFNTDQKGFMINGVKRLPTFSFTKGKKERRFTQTQTDKHNPFHVTGMFTVSASG